VAVPSVERRASMGGADGKGVLRYVGIDDKQRRNLAIAFSRLPDVETLQINIFNLEMLEEDQLEMLKNVQQLSPEDIEQMKAIQAENPDGRWDRPEQYLMGIAEVPHAQLRLQCWYLTMTAKSLKTDVAQWSSQLQVAFDSLVNSKALKTFLGIVLAFGNYMNGGTERGQADGFGIEALTKLAAVKATSDGSLLDFCIREFARRHPDQLDALQQDILPARAAARTNLVDEDQSIRAFREQLDAATGMMKQVNEGPLQPYKGHTIDRMRDSLPQRMLIISEEVKELEDSVAELHEVYGKVLDWFCMPGNARTKPTNDFMQMWVEFGGELEKVVGKLTKAGLLPAPGTGTGTGAGGAPAASGTA